MKNIKLQKELNQIAKLSMISGEIFIVVSTNAADYKELDEVSESTLSELVIPEGFDRNENLISRNELKIYVSFKK
jgi:hypothetical protein